MLVTTEEQYQEMLEKLRAGPTVTVYDLETTGLHAFQQDRLIGVAILIPDMTGTTTGESFYLPFRHQTGVNLPITALYRLAPFLADPTRWLVGFNLKFDVHFTEAERIPVFNQYIDVMLAAHLANENELGFGLKKLGAKYIDATAAQAELDLTLKLKAQGLKKNGMQYLLPEEVAPYAEQDVRLTWQLAQFYQHSLTEQGIESLWAEVNEYAQVVTAMERRGVLVDPRGCRRQLEHAIYQQTELYAQMEAIVGAPFNPSSVPQLRKILGQQATDRAALAVCEHPLARPLLKYRSWAKAAGTYYQNFLNNMDHACRVHPNLNMIGTVSSRLSCTQPNLQALPKDNDVYAVRDLIVAPPGYVLMAWDWSQVELRLLAHYSEDPFLLEAYRQDKDIHQETADRLNIPRDTAKRTNFSMVYGVGKDGLAEALGIAVPVAAQLLNRYHRMIPGIRTLSRTAEQIATSQRRIPMWTGRLRHYRDEDLTYRGMSHLIQGGVAEMMRVAITALHNLMVGTSAHLILQVHDEVLCEIPVGQEAHWAKLIKATMEKFHFSVPIKAEGKIGYAWGKSYTRPIVFDDTGTPTWEPIPPREERI